MPPELSPVYRFGEFEVNPIARTLMRKEAAIGLSRRSFDLLLYFVQNSGKILSKDELLKQIWPDTFVDENSLAKSISVLRKALDDGSNERNFVLTLPGRGYQFGAPVEVIVPCGGTIHAALDLGAETQAIGILRQQRTIRTSVSEVQQNPTRLTARGLFALVLGVTIALGAAAGAGYLLWRHLHPAPLSVSVVLADFENTTGDRDFDVALNRVFQIELEQSPFLEIVPRSTVRQTLTEMQRKADEPLTQELAREVCERNNAQAVLSASISNFAGKYLLIMNASSCVTGKSLAGFQQQVNQKGDVLAALDRAAGRVRKQLGESASSLDKFQKPIAVATTSSLEALRTYTQAQDAFYRGDEKTAEALFQKAIDLDGNFATAYRALAVALYNRREYAQAAALIQKAYSLRSHTTERDRLTIEILYNAFGTYDYQATISSMRLFNQLFPSNATNWANLCGMYTLVGDYAQAVEAGEITLRFGVHAAQISEMAAVAYERANRFADAKRVATASIADGKETFDLHQVLFQIAVAENDAAVRKSEGDWGLTHDKSDYALDDLGMAAAAEGKVHEAVGDFSRARREVERQGDSDFAEALALDIVDTMSNAGDLEQAIASLNGLKVTGNASGHFARLKAELGDMGPARKFIAEVNSIGGTNTIHRYRDLPMLRALLALDAHQPTQAVEEMEPARLYQMVDFEIPSLRGRAEAEAGMLERAADDYRLILANRGIAPISPLYTVAHLRLARVLVMEKNTAAARAEYKAFLNAWKDGDPQEPLLLQAKEEYAKLPAN
ncbi:MAG: winged helix-turn-helix domain-containing protein [Terracidiphilus sp.]|jgi:DNA-binding winged helix-turn-helix (wHTH) protein/tetratricopeptide (TPR) repeat protein